jgi:hypothetical protein
LFISPIRTVPGPPWTDTGEPGAFTNNDCCGAFEGAFPAGQEIKNDVQNAISSDRANRPKPLIVAGICGAELTVVSFSAIMTNQHHDFFRRINFTNQALRLAF